MFEAKNLSFRYRREKVLEDVSFCARPGELTAVIGANGTGKTTLLKCISGLESCHGQITLFGEDMAAMSRMEWASQLSYMEQSTDCSAELTVYEIVLLGRLDKLGFTVSQEDTACVDGILERMNLTQFAQRKISQLSGGQKQMVFIAQALVKSPRMLILDEPTSALDLNKQFILMDFLRKITREKNYISIMSLHHLDIAMEYADRVVVLCDGVVYAQGEPRQVMTAQMLRDVFRVESELCQDKNGRYHLIATNCL